MNAWSIFLIEILLIFFSSRYIFQSLFTLAYIFTKSQKLSIMGISLFFFPGTVLHELSHFIVAEILRVKTHGMEFKPEYTNGRLKMGSVLISETDFLRNFLIGVAPFVVGCSVIVASLFTLFTSFSYRDVFYSPASFLITLGIVLLLFIVTNTMFSSKKDMEGAVELLVGILVVIGVLYIAGVRPEHYIGELLFQKSVLSVIKSVNVLLLVPLSIDIFVILVTHTILSKKGYR